MFQKKSTIVFLLFLSFFALAGCSTTEEEKKEEKKEEKAQSKKEEKKQVWWKKDTWQEGDKIHAVGATRVNFPGRLSAARRMAQTDGKRKLAQKQNEVMKEIFNTWKEKTKDLKKSGSLELKEVGTRVTAMPSKFKKEGDMLYAMVSAPLDDFYLNIENVLSQKLTTFSPESRSKAEEILKSLMEEKKKN